MSDIRFNVFGKIIAVRRENDGWKVCAIGNDGKRGPAGIEIPEFVEADELAQYLFDIFHENARPGNNEVHRIG